MTKRATPTRPGRHLPDTAATPPDDTDAASAPLLDGPGTSVTHPGRRRGVLQPGSTNPDGGPATGSLEGIGGGEGDESGTPRNDPQPKPRP